MKATKALKRLAKIDSLMTDVAERFKGSPQIREALQETRAALNRIKAVVSAQASAEKAKASKAHLEEPRESPKRKGVAEGKVTVQAGVEAIGKAGDETKAVPAPKKAAAKGMAAKTPDAITAKKRAPIKRGSIKRVPIKVAAKKNTAPKQTAQVPVEIPAVVATDPATLETAPADVEVQSEPVAQMSVGH